MPLSVDKFIGTLMSYEAENINDLNDKFIIEVATCFIEFSLSLLFFEDLSRAITSSVLMMPVVATSSCSFSVTVA